MNLSFAIYRYAGIYALSYGAFVATLCVVSFFFDLGSGANFALALAAAYVTTHYFVKDYGRKPGYGEIRLLSLMSVVVSWVLSSISILVMTAFFAHGSLHELRDFMGQFSPSFMVSAFVLVSVVYYLLLVFCYGKFGEYLAKAYAKEE